MGTIHKDRQQSYSLLTASLPSAREMFLSRCLIFRIYEPSHENMALFVLRKLILQTRMRSHSVGLDV